MADRPIQPTDTLRTTREIKALPPLAEAALKAWMEVVDGPDQGRTAELNASCFVIGSERGCNLVLTDPTASRRHCQIVTSPVGYYLYDLGSTNGTFVDGLRTGEVGLADGVRIEVGNTVLRFRTAALTQDGESWIERLRVPLVGTSAPMKTIAAQILKVAPTDLSVIIEGDTGTGKELVARAIHAHSQRSSRPFIVFDCSAFPPSLLESELYGHEKGAFSGAVAVHKGVFERADGGTIFFDELGEMGIEFQAKFLRALESGEIRRVGGEHTFEVDVRVIVATNRDLEKLIADNKFRQDLFYRLAKVRLHVPPLRDRVEDIPPLVDHFLREAGFSASKAPVVTAEAMDVLCAYPWPGNVRELRNIVERAAALCDTDRITAEFLKPQLGVGMRIAIPEPTDVRSNSAHEHLLPSEFDEAVPLREAKEQIISDFESRYLARLLEKHNQNVSRVAREAKIDRRHLYRLLKKYDLMDSQTNEKEESD